MAECKYYYKQSKKLSSIHEQEHCKENRNEPMMRPSVTPAPYKKEACIRSKDPPTKKQPESRKPYCQRSTIAKSEKPESSAKAVEAKSSNSSLGLLSVRSSFSCYTPKPRPPHLMSPLVDKKDKEREKGGQAIKQPLEFQETCPTDATSRCHRSDKKQPESPDRCPSLSLELLSPWVTRKDCTSMSRPTLPPLPDKRGKECKPIADGDRVIYKNSTFGLDFSACDTNSDITVKSTKILRKDEKLPQKNVQLENKDSSPLVKSAREHCKQMHERFKTKHFEDDLLSSDCESRKTTISCKSGANLRTVVCSQIKIQEIIDETNRKLNKAKEEQETKLTTLDFSNSSEDFKQICHNKIPSKAKVAQKTQNGSPLEILSDDVVSPLVRKVQRMYLKTLNEEMSLLEDLEKLPVKCHNVFQPKNGEVEEAKNEDGKEKVDKEVEED